MAHRRCSSCLAGEAPSASAYEDLGRTSWSRSARESTQPKRFTGEETVRGPREEQLGSTVRFRHVPSTALGFSLTSEPG